MSKHYAGKKAKDLARVNNTIGFSLASNSHGNL